jgi:hypothetical protein
VKRPLILLALIILTVAAASWWFQRARRDARPAASTTLPIQDRVTIDFSTGAPVIKDDAVEQAIIDAALKDIQDAAKNIRFEPLVPPKIDLPPSEK